MGTITSFIDI